MELAAILLITMLILLAGVTVIGHGLWIVLSKLFGQPESRTNSTRVASSLGRRACPRCLTPLPPNELACQVCGWPGTSRPAGGEVAALAAVRQQLERFAQLGVVDSKTTETLTAALLEQSARASASRVAAADAQSIPSVELVPIEAADAGANGTASAVSGTHLDADNTVAELPVPQTPASPSDRVQRYAASRAAAESAAEEGPARAAIQPPKHREAMSRLLATFMEEKNIRWGELIGGLLIVGCSIALVISFWSEIAARPLLKFVLFNGVTAALFGVGLYTDRRWKIHTTSHGVLAIATLLVPLNFLAIAAFTQDSPPTDALALGGEAVSLIVFTLLVFFAGKVLVPDAAALLAAGVIIPSLMQLLVRRYAEPLMPLAAMYALAAAPLAVYLVATLVVARRRWSKWEFDETSATQLLLFLGEATAAAIVPIALLAYHVPPVQETLHWLAPLVLVGGLPALVVGLYFWRNSAAAQAETRAAALTSATSVEPSAGIGLQTTGIAAGVLGALVMAAAVVLAWPDPATLLPTAIAAALVLSGVAWGFGVPAAHVPAGIALAVAWLVAFHLVRGNVGWTLPNDAPLRGALLSAESGHALVPLVAIFAAGAGLLQRIRRQEDARIMFFVAALAAAASLALVVWFGFARAGDPQNATWTLAIYALVALAAASRIDRPAVGWVGTALLLAALVQGIVYRYADAWTLERPWIVALLAHATLATALLGALARWRPRMAASLRECLDTSSLITSAFAALLIAAAAPLAAYGTMALYLAWLAAVWTLMAIFADRPRMFDAAQVAMVPALATAAAASATRSGFSNEGAYHVLLVGCGAAAWLLPLLTPRLKRAVAMPLDDIADIRWCTLPTCFLAAIAVWLAIWEYSSTVSVWTVATLAAMSAWCVWVAWHDRRGAFMWPAAALAVLTTSIAWIEWGTAPAGAAAGLSFNWANTLTGTIGSGVALEFLWINGLIVAFMAVASVWIHRRRVLIRTDYAERQGLVPFHRFAAWLLVATLLLTTGIGLIADWFGEPIEVNFILAWATWAAAAMAAIACWWDPAVRWPVACLYCVGLLAVGLFLDGLDFRPPMFHWALAGALAAYSLLTSAFWSRRCELRAALTRSGAVSEATAGAKALPTTSSHAWLVTANNLLGVVVLILVAAVEFTMHHFAHRMVAAYAIGAQALAIGFLARGAVRTSLQYTALVFGILFAVAFGWAWLRPGMEAPWLHRWIVTSVALAVMVVVYGFGLVKLLRRENEWTRAAARLVPPLAAAAAALLLVVLAIEVAIFQRQGFVPIVGPALVAVALALVGLFTAALAAALLPGRDPLGLSERGRTLYIYAAEGLAALLFLHIRVTMPYLFTGWFTRFWPLIVMVIAFVGVGLGEVFRRRRVRVLSEPFENTGALLPLLPALGFWFVNSNIDYSLLLLSIGALYAALSVLRRSFLFGVLAAISANGSLWYLLFRQEGLGLLEHPQLWLIPPALSALIASYINRHRMTEEQSTAVRYLSAIVIYVSSTADIFINGVAEAPWLPAVLAGLSILGVFAGIVLRVRAFLYLGTSFLLVSLMTIIWYAAVEQQRTWILWVAGIVTGVLIIALFGLFEKRRDDVLRVVDELKQWQP